FNTGGVREAIINQETGLLVKPNSNELANAILKLLKNEELRNKMGKKGREFVSKYFSWDNNAKKLLEIYQEANLMRK
ncbi:glycosyltransferase family 4 protein, partial [Candidatus Bathyarchaeota archaeon]|nr:glycosyltransferase family 4 protein [Candidatus Bathyarchaeota archaeon]